MGYLRAIFGVSSGYLRDILGLMVRKLHGKEIVINGMFSAQA